MIIPALPLRFGWSQAVAFFSRPRPGNLFGIAGRKLRPCPAGSGRLPVLECLWLPYYLVAVSTRFRGQQDRKDMAVESWSGAAVISERGPDIQPREVGDACLLPPKLSREEAEEYARKTLFALFMRGRAQLSRPAVEEILSADLYYHPYWVLYQRMWFRNGVRIDLMDAYTGTACGGQVRHAVLNALVLLRKQGNTPKRIED